MTTEEAQKIFDHMKEIFGDHLPNMEQEPLRFEYYVKLYKYFYQGKDDEQAIEQVGSADQ